MDKTDSKIRLFFELTYQKEVEIKSFIPLKNFSESWKPEKMYKQPKSQYYYVFINDPELIKIIKKEEKKGQDHLYEIAKIMETNPEYIFDNSCLIEFNANSIIENDIKKPNEEQYVVFTRISIDDFNFINDYKTASKKHLLDDNKPLIYANKGRIKEFLNDINNEENNLNNSEAGNKDEKKDEDIDDKINNAKKQKSQNLFDNKIPGNWFLVNMSNLNFIKKNEFDNLKKQKLIKFLGVIKYREVANIDQENNNNQASNSNHDINISQDEINESKDNNELINNVDNINNPFQQPQEFAFRSTENSKLITVYQPKSCKIHLRKNDFWCKTCNIFCCLQCLAGNDENSHRNHKVHLLDEIINKIADDSEALDERIKNLIKIIEGEIEKKQKQIDQLKTENEEMVKIIQALYDDNNKIIRDEELKRTKELAAFVNEILRIYDENNRRTKYLNKLFDNKSMNEYLTNYYIYKNIFVEETKKNLDVIERKVNELINFYKKNK